MHLVLVLILGFGYVQLHSLFQNTHCLTYSGLRSYLSLALTRRDGFQEIIESLIGNSIVWMTCLIRLIEIELCNYDETCQDN